MKKGVWFLWFALSSMVFADARWETMPTLELSDQVDSDFKSPVWGGVWEESDSASTNTLDSDINPLESLFKGTDETNLEERPDLEFDDLDEMSLEEQKLNQIAKESPSQGDELLAEPEEITSEL